MGQLTQTVTLSSVTIAITTVGAVDWSNWGATSVIASDWKSGAGNTIANPTVIGTAAIAAGYTGDPRTVGWTDGTFIGTNNSTNGIYNGGGNAGDGFQIVLVADLNVRTVYIYIGAFNATSPGTITATLSDGSAGPVTDSTTLTGPGSTSIDGVIKLVFQANSNGQTLTVTWVQGAAGNVTLQAAAIASITAGGASPYPVEDPVSIFEEVTEDETWTLETYDSAPVSAFQTASQSPFQEPWQEDNEQEEELVGFDSSPVGANALVIASQFTDSFDYTDGDFEEIWWDDNYFNVATNSRVVIPSGGIILGGSAAEVRVRVYSATGGLVFSGSAPVSYLRQEGARSGGLILGGSAPDLRNFVYSASGGLILGGTGSPIAVRVEPNPTGGLVFGGSAGYSTHVSSITWTSTGGMVFGGSAPVTFIHAGGGGTLQRIRKWSSIKDLYNS